LVLIPDGEDPDSYVTKNGTAALKQLIETRKKDFILFQLEVMLQEAGNDVNRKSAAVNQVAETISKLNKLEDFTRQQDYIRQCASLLKIDENGLTSLVNKFKRERVSKEERKTAINEQGDWVEKGQEPPVGLPDDGAIELLGQDELPEKNLIRVLLLYGLQEWENGSTVAEFITAEISEFQLDVPLMNQFYQEYQRWYDQGWEPGLQNFLNHEEEEIRKNTLAICAFPYELSQRWKEHLDIRNNVLRDNSRQDVLHSLHYFKLRKIKKMMEENQRDLENASPDQLRQFLEIHRHLKELEIELTRSMGAVIVK
jgi:DNA primase